MPTQSAEHEGTKETIESIVIALILAFVFRAFIVEAFVIPTGSMAPTLNGAHGTILCEDCGSGFAYGLRDPSDSRRGNMVSANAHARCPNCGHLRIWQLRLCDGCQQFWRVLFQKNTKVPFGQ